MNREAPVGFSVPLMKSLFKLPFDRITAARGHQLFQAGGVRQIYGDRERIEAHVVDAERPQTVTYMRHGDEAWVARCTCAAGAEGGCLHAHAAMLAVQEGVRRREVMRPFPPSATTASPSQPPRAMGEKAFHAALERAFFESRRIKKLSNALLASVIPEWPDLTPREWTPWPTGAAPQDVNEFWQYVALALNDAGQPIPEFMRGVTHLAETTSRIQSIAAHAETARWEKVISQFTSSTPLGRPERIAIRLVIRPDEAHLDWRPDHDVDAHGFQEIGKPELQRFMTLARQSLLGIVPDAASVLWLTFLNHWQQFQVLALDCSLPRTRKILNGLFTQPGLASHLVGVDGQPFAVGAALRWECQRSDDGTSYLIQLGGAGRAEPETLMHLPGAKSLYLGAKSIHEGPATGNFLAGDHYVHVLPASAIEGRTGIELLHRLGIETPAHLRKKIRRVPMTVELVCELETKGFKHPHEELSVLARAVAEDGERVEVLMRDQWVLETEAPVVPGQPIPLFDRTPLAQIPALLEKISLKPGRFDARWRRRVEDDFPAAFAAWLRELPEGVTATVADAQLATLQSAPLRPKLTFDLRPSPNGTAGSTDWFDVNIDLDVKDTKLTAAEMKLLLRARGNYVRLKGKGWRRLELNIDGGMQSRLAQLGLDPEDFAAGAQRLHALQLADPSLGSFFDAAQFSQLRSRFEQLVGNDEVPELPEGITAELRPYQLEGFHFLARLSRCGLGGILADDMGLGKTVQALVWLTWVRHQSSLARQATLTKNRNGANGHAEPASADVRLSPAPAPSLVVCPKSVMENWAREAAKFAPGLRVQVLHPRPGGRMAEPEPSSADVFVVNYAQLRRRADFYTKTHWLAVILDEGQNIKNPDSQSARTVRALRADHRLVLTGTPIENRLLDLWSLMAFATPGILGQRGYFERQFEKRDDPLARQRIAARLRPFLLRRTKREVAPDLPPRVEEDHLCELEGVQADLYRAELKRARGMLLGIESQRQFNEQRFNILQSLLRLRQICCHPGLIDPTMRGESSAKLEALFDLLEPLRDEGHKVLVFSQFVSMLDILRERMIERGWTYFYLTGQTEDRGALVDEFQESPDPAVFLLSLKAAGSGLNLMAASYVVLFDPWWNPAVEAQAIDRTHRIGQANQVMAYRLLVKDSVEEKIRALQERKASLALDVLGVGEASGSLELKDFDFLFSDEPVAVK